MWSITAWDKIKLWFPDNCNRSRIIVSTRILKVANDLGSSKVVRVGLLDESKSWELFCVKAFAQHDRGCPAELEQIGKRIVQKCRGLPLSIVVIGAFLGKSPRETEYWENISENMSSILSSGEDTLCLSYIHLPAHLKPCFLYLGIFREDREIHVSQLVKLWISEGFIKPNKDERRSLEEVAEGYINDLFERSLILVKSLDWKRKLESFLVHDLVRELCLRESQKEKFICVVEALDEPTDIDSERCIVVSGGAVKNYGRSFCNVLGTRSLICEWGGAPSFIGSTLLRVLMFVSSVDIDSDNTVNMRLITSDVYSNSCVGYLPRSIFLFWNLQTLVLSHTRLKSKTPVGIWKLPQLRHVEFLSIRLTEPAPLSDQGEEFVLHNLQTLMTVRDLRCSEEICRRIPNIKRLHLHYKYILETTYNSIQNIGSLNKLESLSYCFNEVPDRDHLLQNMALPASLKQLSLEGSCLHWDDDIMRIIGSLPNLEFLKLYCSSFKGREWNCIEGEFLRLKYLYLEFLDLEEWNVESSHFPVLETLVLENMYHLKEIPSGIGDIPTLTCIRVESCSNSLNLSAMKILEEQESLGNDPLQIQLMFFNLYVQREFMKRQEMEGITCSNFTMKTL